MDLIFTSVKAWRSGGNGMALILLIVVAIILYWGFKCLDERKTAGKTDRLDDRIITLTNIVIKIASKHLENGIFFINERHGEYGATFSHFDTYQKGVLDVIIGLTQDEIDFLLDYSSVEHNMGMINIEIGHSDITYNAVMDLIASNRHVFSKVEAKKDGYIDVYFGR